MVRWKRLFREIDADHSGRVSVSELKKALSGCINPVPSDVFDEWVSQYDVNKDGELSYEEFLGFVTDQY
ncbi:unnamed protein product [Protopolystoma xenopodis]|uniref:EF-hand domain-containing protein n=1 Tax=Protopolystoma xenopodis TaxID=117903 RepID=A0A3S5CUG0_9PLAT|nr:unnamed protein product [Protopolystoma xenopodis]